MKLKTVMYFEVFFMIILLRRYVCLN